MVFSFVSSFFLKKMYAENAINTNPNKILKISGATSDEIIAPKTVQGTDNNPSLIPNGKSILFCLVYETVDATELLSAAKRLLLAAAVGGNPINVNTGTTIIPPPSPIIEPRIPPAKPNKISQS
jgi:hypothetical protein